MVRRGYPLVQPLPLDVAADLLRIGRWQRPPSKPIYARMSWTTSPSTSVRRKLRAVGVFVGETRVVQAQHMQHRGVQVVNVDFVFRGIIAVVIGGAPYCRPGSPPLRPASHIV